jgi:hypothetical protein
MPKWIFQTTSTDQQGVRLLSRSSANLRHVSSLVQKMNLTQSSLCKSHDNMDHLFLLTHGLLEMGYEGKMLVIVLSFG